MFTKWQGSLLLVLSVLAVVFLAASKRESNSIVRARGLVITDDEGNQRVKIVGSDLGETGITMYDSQGQERLYLGASDIGSRIVFFDGDGSEKLELSVQLKDGSHLRMLGFSKNSENLPPILDLRVQRWAKVRFYDEGGKARIRIQGVPMGQVAWEEGNWPILSLNMDDHQIEFSKESGCQATSSLTR